jgi:hypothetical protein
MEDFSFTFSCGLSVKRSSGVSKGNFSLAGMRKPKNKNTKNRTKYRAKEFGISFAIVSHRCRRVQGAMCNSFVLVI